MSHTYSFHSISYKKPSNKKMTSLILLISSLLATSLPSFATGASCSFPSYTDTVNNINQGQPFVEGSAPVVLSLYYNCIQWDSTLNAVQRLIVSVELDNSVTQRWLVFCTSSSTFGYLKTSGVALLNNSSTTSYDCGRCDASAANPCLGRATRYSINRPLISAIFIFLGCPCWQCVAVLYYTCLSPTGVITSVHA